MPRILILALFAASASFSACGDEAGHQLPIEPSAVDLEAPVRAGGTANSTTTSGYMTFNLDGRTYWDGSRFPKYNCTSFTLTEVIWDDFPPDRIETKRHQCDDTPPEWGGAVVATVSWNGASAVIAKFEADFEKTASEAFELGSGETLTLKLDADPYTSKGCKFRYFYAWNSGVTTQSDPAYFTLGMADDGELITARFDCTS